MFLRDIELVTEKIKQYGLKPPFVDLGGLRAKDITVADYSRTLASGVQSDRYLTLTQDPFVKIAGENYLILNPEYGSPAIESLPEIFARDRFGTAVCCNVIEHVVNPFEVFKAIYEIMQPGGLVIITTVFSFPYHASGGGHDFFRFSPPCLEMLGKYAGFEVLEFGYHLQIFGNEGILDKTTGRAQEIQATFCVMRKQ